MEYHGDDWPPEWDDSGRIGGRIYGRWFWGALTVAGVLFLILAGVG